MWFMDKPSVAREILIDWGWLLPAKNPAVIPLAGKPGSTHQLASIRTVPLV